MRWFGGFNNPAAPVRTPDEGSAWPSVPDLPGCWRVGHWAGHEFRTTRTGTRTVAVIGPCGMTRADLHRLGVHGVPDDVAWRWPGSYTTVEVTGEGVRVWTDLGGAWPIYFTREHGGVYWASSSRVLAALTGNRVDTAWLAAGLLAPDVPGVLGNRSAFAGIDHVPPGCRLHCGLAAP